MRKITRLKWELKVFLFRLKSGLIIILKAPFIYKNWVYFITSRFTKKQNILYLKNGLKFNIRPKGGDRATISEIFILKTYEKKFFKINYDDIILDIGAYIGAFTIYAANIAKKGKIYSIEPVKESFNSLCENIKLNNLENVVLFNVAVDSSEGVRKIYLGGSKSSFFWGNQRRIELVKTTTLEHFLDKNNLQIVNFLKMDCEGAEFDILLNIRKNVLNKIRKIVLEYHNLSPRKNAKILKCYLEEKGFKVKMPYGEWNGILFAKK